MRNGYLLAAIAILGLCGCKHEETVSDPDGNKVPVANPGGKMSTDSNGNVKEFGDPRNNGKAPGGDGKATRQPTQTH